MISLSPCLNITKTVNDTVVPYQQTFDPENTTLFFVATKSDLIATIELPQGALSNTPQSSNVFIVTPVNSYPTSQSLVPITKVFDLSILQYASNGSVSAITTFSAPIKFSFSFVNKQPLSSLCLGYLNNSNWVCEDKNLTIESGQIVGYSTHFTEFSLLVEGSGEASVNNPSTFSTSNIIIISVVIGSVVILSLFLFGGYFWCVE